MLKEFGIVARRFQNRKGRRRSAVVRGADQTLPAQALKRKRGIRKPILAFSSNRLQPSVVGLSGCVQHLNPRLATDFELPEKTVKQHIGCGDGQISRRLAATGATVIGVDPTWNQITVAASRAGGPGYAAATADGLPLPDASVDAAMACLVFEHIDAVDAAIAEAARVVRPGGRFCFFLNHPLLQTPDSGWIDDHMVDPPEQYWRVGPYLIEAETVEQVELGVFIRFIHRPLSRYLNACFDAGFVLERMVEPAPPPGFVARAPEYAEVVTIPRLLYLRLVRAGDPGSP